jgi:hypothetical protein
MCLNLNRISYILNTKLNQTYCLLWMPRTCISHYKTLCVLEFKDNLPNPWNSHFHEPNISHQKTFPELKGNLTMKQKIKELCK